MTDDKKQYDVASLSTVAVHETGHALMIEFSRRSVLEKVVVHGENKIHSNSGMAFSSPLNPLNSYRDIDEEFLREVLMQTLAGEIAQEEIFNRKGGFKDYAFYDDGHADAQAAALLFLRNNDYKSLRRIFYIAKLDEALAPHVALFVSNLITKTLLKIFFPEASSENFIRQRDMLKKELEDKTRLFIKKNIGVFIHVSKRLSEVGEMDGQDVRQCMEEYYQSNPSLELE